MVWPVSGHGRPTPLVTIFALGLGLAPALGCDSSGTIVRTMADAGRDAQGVSDVVTATPDASDVDIPRDASPDVEPNDATDGADDAQDAASADADAGQDAPNDAGAEAQTDGGIDAAPDADAGDASTAPHDSGNGADAIDSTVPQDAMGGMDGGVDATLRDSAPEVPAAQDSGVDAADTSAAVDSGTITCTTTRRIVFANGCIGMVTVEDDVGLFPVNLPSLGWAGGLGTDSSGISELYTNNSVPNPGQQVLLATDPTLALYVGYTMIPGDGGPNDWGTALRTDSEITSFTLNASRQGGLPPNCNLPEIAVQCSGRTTIGCQWYGQACGGPQACCPDSIFTPIGDAGPWPVACTANACCNPSGASCNTGVACCAGVCGGDAGTVGRQCL